jgi:sRNA-binding protein
MDYRADRDDKEMIVRMLVEHYPKCFFAEPKLRRPLKSNIIADLQKDGFPVANELTVAGVEWYKSHISYQYSLEAGAKRIDLNGKAVGTVTEKEFAEAQGKIRDIKQKRGDKNATQMMSTLHVAGRISDDQLKKLDAPTLKPKNPEFAPPSKLAKLYEALDAAHAALSGPNAGALQVAIATAALGVLIEKAQHLCDEIAGDTEEAVAVRRQQKS